MKSHFSDVLLWPKSISTVNIFFAKYSVVEIAKFKKILIIILYSIQCVCMCTIVLYLLKMLFIIFQTLSGLPVLCAAAKEGLEPHLEKLLDKGADPNARDPVRSCTVHVLWLF